MSERGEKKVDKGKQPEEDKTTPTTEKQECCCKDVAVILTAVTVTKNTDAPHPFFDPIFGKLAGWIVDDRVSVVGTAECTGEQKTWPHGAARASDSNEQENHSRCTDGGSQARSQVLVGLFSSQSGV